MQADKTECPVCGQQFRSSFIDTHVNSCLNKSNSQSQSKMECGTKRKSTNDWDFLTQTQNKTARSGGNKIQDSTKTAHARNNKPQGNRPSKFGKSKENSQAASTSSSIQVEVEDDEQSSDVELIEVETVNGDVDQRVSNERTSTFQSQRSVNDDKSLTDQQSKSSFSFFNTARASGNKKDKKSNAPLAERVRPQTFEEFVGQTKAVGKRSLLHSLLMKSDNVPSMILWGPPGCGKTTLAKVVAHKCQQCQSTKFVSMSATSASVADVKALAKVAKNDVKMFRRKTILFLDEIHRFNKLQQDALLPHVEDGTITLIGATTENPSFHVNGALLSRCRVITLEKLQVDDIKAILLRAIAKMGVIVKTTQTSESLEGVEVEEEEDDFEGEDELEKEESSQIVYMEDVALDALAGFVDGDARTALNGLQMAVEGRQAEVGPNAVDVIVTLENVKEGLQRSHVLYDRNGEEHFNIASALIKSMRGSDANAALYWMARMLEGGENPLFIARRLVVFASEDVGLADPSALNQAVSTYHACHLIGMPECGVNLAQCVVYLSRAAKSVEVYMAYQAARNCVKEQEGAMPSVPLHLRNASTQLMKSMGYGKGYKYPPAFGHDVEQEYFPECLKGTDFFFKPGSHPGEMK